MELTTEQREFLREYTTDCICDDMDDAVDFVGMREDIKSTVADKVDGLNDIELVDVVVIYSGSESIDDILVD